MKQNRAFTMVEILVVTLLVAFLLGSLMKILLGTFSSAAHGYQSLSIFQETSKLMTQLKHDLRTIIVGGPDAYPAPTLTPFPTGTGNTTAFEFHKVWSINQAGRPIGLIVTYKLVPGANADDPVGVERITGAGTSDEKRVVFAPKMLTTFRVELLNGKGEAITDPGRLKEVRRAQVTLETKGSELLQSMISIYSPYLNTDVSEGIGELWRPNFTCEPFVPGSAIRIYQGGVIRGAGMTALGVPCIISGERPLTN